MIKVISLFIVILVCIFLGILRVTSRNSWFFGTDEHGHENNLINPVYFVVLLMIAIMEIIIYGQ